MKKIVLSLILSFLSPVSGVYSGEIDGLDLERQKKPIASKSKRNLTPYLLGTGALSAVAVVGTAIYLLKKNKGKNEQVEDKSDTPDLRVPQTDVLHADLDILQGLNFSQFNLEKYASFIKSHRSKEMKKRLEKLDSQNSLEFEVLPEASSERNHDFSDVTSEGPLYFRSKVNKLKNFATKADSANSLNVTAYIFSSEFSNVLPALNKVTLDDSHPILESEYEKTFGYMEKFLLTYPSLFVLLCDQTHSVTDETTQTVTTYPSLNTRDSILFHAKKYMTDSREYAQENSHFVLIPFSKNTKVFFNTIMMTLDNISRQYSDKPVVISINNLSSVALNTKEILFIDAIFLLGISQVEGEQLRYLPSTSDESFLNTLSTRFAAALGKKPDMTILQAIQWIEKMTSPHPTSERVGAQISDELSYLGYCKAKVYDFGNYLSEKSQLLLGDSEDLMSRLFHQIFYAMGYLKLPGMSCVTPSEPS